MSASESIGKFDGEIHPSFDSGRLRTWLAGLPEHLRAEGLDEPREFITHLRPFSGGPRLSIRRFPPDAPLPAHRPDRTPHTYAMALRLAESGVPAPAPVAWLRPREANRNGYLITESIPDSCSLRGALLHHYYEDPLCSRIVSLLEAVAKTLRQFHEAGFRHPRLLNRGITVRRDGEEYQAWLNDPRGVSGQSKVSAAERGRDNALLDLPSDLRRIFFQMQFAPDTVPEEFLAAERRARKRLARHRQPPAGERAYPADPDIWIWDDRSRQAIPALRSRDKRRHYRKRDVFPLLRGALRHGPALRNAFRELQAEAWQQPVDLSDRIGLSLNLEPDRFEQERCWLHPLGPLPLLVRLYHHESPANQRYAIEAVRKLQAEGHAVTVALVQDRRAVTVPSAWRDFVDRAGGALSGFVEAFEVGHAINRVKWGIWNVPEYRGLIEPFQDWANRFPQIPLIGPAGIDFEYPRVLPFLDCWPEGGLRAFSHHLYVDRRGAPENRQGKFDTVDKLVLARALARVHPACREERVIVSEVNWPLTGTGVWSPVGSPYQSPGARFNDPSVDEDTYSDYMRRYLLLALCSGMADRVYWWNLAAHGFGLIDDRDPGGWRPRPAYHSFQTLVNDLRGARYLKKRQQGSHITLDLIRSETPFTLEWDFEAG